MLSGASTGYSLAVHNFSWPLFGVGKAKVGGAKWLFGMLQAACMVATGAEGVELLQPAVHLTAAGVMVRVASLVAWQPSLGLAGGQSRPTSPAQA